MATTDIQRDVYFVLVKEPALNFHRPISLYSFLTASVLKNGLYVGHLCEPDTGTVLVYEAADDLDSLRKRMDTVVECIGECLFCYRGHPHSCFQWFGDADKGAPDQ